MTKNSTLERNIATAKHHIEDAIKSRDELLWTGSDSAGDDRLLMKEIALIAAAHAQPKLSRKLGAWSFALDCRTKPHAMTAGSGMFDFLEANRSDT